MRLHFTEQGWEDYSHWQAADPDILKRLNELIRDTRRSPLAGIGKPEPLAGSLRGWWSLRVDREHRLVHRVTGQGDAQALEISACRHRCR